MIAAIRGFICEKGTDWQRQIVLQESEEGAAIDLTGSTVTMQVRTKVGGALLADLTEGNGSVTIDAEAGTVTFDLDDATTAALPTAGLLSGEVRECVLEDGTVVRASGYLAHYRITIQWSTGRDDRLLEGPFCIVP